MKHAVVPVFAALCLAGCSKPAPPEKERPVEPQAQASTTQRPYGNPHALRDYMQKPIDKAKTAEQVTLDAAKQQSADIDAQMAGDAPAPQTPPQE